jgi:hypothetical protein
MTPSQICFRSLSWPGGERAWRALDGGAKDAGVFSYCIIVCERGDMAQGLCFAVSEVLSLLDC